MESEGTYELVRLESKVALNRTYQTSNASNEPSLIFHHISGLNIDSNAVSAEKAESKQDTEIVLLLNAFHNH
jgi:hypothetical protein